MQKNITLHIENQQLIEKAKQNNRLAQKQLYELYSSAMLSVCRLYINDLHFAEDVLLKSFFKIFTNLHLYKEQNHFYAWIRRIVVNECLDFLRNKKQKIQFTEWTEKYDEIDEDVENQLLTEEKIVQTFIDELPSGARTVFNLYVFEDYSHQQISDELKISVGTSKSQLAYAKKMLKQKIQYNKSKQNI